MGHKTTSDVIITLLQEQPFTFLIGLAVPRSMSTYFEKEILGVPVSSTKLPANTFSHTACSFLEIGNVLSFPAITLYLSYGT